MRKAIPTLLTACLIFAANPAFSQTQAVQGGPSYADMADLAWNAPLAVRATIRKVRRLPAEIAMRAPEGHRRVLVEARIVSLIRGEQSLPRDISYLYDAPASVTGRTARLPKEVLLFAAPVAGRPGQVTLLDNAGQQEWSPENEALLKSILAELLAAPPMPRIIGIGDAFHVAGTIAGESETQIFLKTRDNEPVSLSIVRRPGQAPHWAAAVGEIVDEGTPKPAPNTLLWYNLACNLPPELPSGSTASLAPGDARAARDDYLLVLRDLGPCGRSLR